MKQQLRISPWATGWLLLLVSATSACGCDVPVFRYALERWQPDAYQAFVIHRGPLSKNDATLVDELVKRTTPPATPVNLQVHPIDLSQSPDASIRKLWEDQQKTALPWVLVTYPPTGTRQGIAWSGPLDGKKLDAVIASPSRAEITRRLLAGDSVVWVLLESGDSSKDQAKAAELEALLKKIAQALAPWTPKTDGPPADNAPADVQLKVKFSVLRLSRNDPAEHGFIQILLNTEQGLDAYREPMVFPVYGQGRVHYAIVGRGINEDNVGQASQFLTGPCSCEVKAQNPGTDLLFVADWMQGLDRTLVPDAAPPPLTGMGADLPQPGSAGTGASSPTPTTTGTGPDSAAPPRRSLALNLAIVLAVTAGVVIISILLIQRRSSRDKPKP